MNIDNNKIPGVKLERSWKLQDGSVNDLYRAGNWSFETDDMDLEYAEEAIYAWIAWYNFVKDNTV
jgi:N12 class adenine-specific DNA methylase